MLDVSYTRQMILKYLFCCTGGGRVWPRQVAADVPNETRTERWILLPSQQAEEYSSHQVGSLLIVIYETRILSAMQLIDWMLVSSSDKMELTSVPRSLTPSPPCCCPRGPPPAPASASLEPGGQDHTRGHEAEAAAAAATARPR